MCTLLLGGRKINHVLSTMVTASSLTENPLCRRDEMICRLLHSCRAIIYSPSWRVVGSISGFRPTSMAVPLNTNEATGKELTIIRMRVVRFLSQSIFRSLLCTSTIHCTIHLHRHFNWIFTHFYTPPAADGGTSQQSAPSKSQFFFLSTRHLNWSWFPALIIDWSCWTKTEMETHTIVAPKFIALLSQFECY